MSAGGSLKRKTKLVDVSTGESHVFESMSLASVFIGRSPGYITDMRTRGNDIAIARDGKEYKYVKVETNG